MVNVATSASPEPSAALLASQRVRRHSTHIDRFARLVGHSRDQRLRLSRHAQDLANALIHCLTLVAVLIHRKTGHQFAISDVVVAFMVLDDIERAGTAEVNQSTSSRSERNSSNGRSSVHQAGRCGDVAYTLPSPDSLMIK